LNVAKKLIDTNIDEQINKDLINYYFTPGKIYNLIKFSNEFDIDIKNLGLKDLIYLIIDQRYYKKDSSIRYLIFELIEFYLRYNLNSKFSTYNYFIRKIENLKKFNLDQESFFLELKSKMLNE
jgi:DNA polymerase-3 subunit delta'